MSGIASIAQLRRLLQTRGMAGSIVMSVGAWEKFKERRCSSRSAGSLGIGVELDHNRQRGLRGRSIGIGH